MSAQPRYGVDAPGVVRGLLGSGAVGLGLGAAFIAFGKPPWTDAVGALLAAAALVPTGLAKTAGELRSGVEPSAALAVLYGPLYTPLLFGGEVPDAEAVQAYLSIAAAGVFAYPPD